MKLTARAFIALALLIVCALAAFAQSPTTVEGKPVYDATTKPTPTPSATVKEAPATLTIPAADLAAARKEGNAATTSRQLIETQIQLLQMQLKEAKEAEAQAWQPFNAAVFAAAEKAGITKDRLPEYDFAERPDGSVVFTRKPPKK